MEQLIIWSNTETYTSAKDIQPVELKRLFEAWEAARLKDGRVVNLPVNAFKKALPHMGLIGLSPEGPRYLLFGQALTSLLGQNPTGMLLKDVYPPDIYREIMDTIDDVRLRRAPVFHRREFRFFGVSMGYFRLMLPLYEKGRIGRIIIGIYPTSKALKYARQWKMALAGYLPYEENTEESWEAEMTREARHTLPLPADTEETEDALSLIHI